MMIRRRVNFLHDPNVFIRQRHPRTLSVERPTRLRSNPHIKTFLLFRSTNNEYLLAGINRAMGSDIPVGQRLFGPERTISAGVIFSFQVLGRPFQLT